MQSARDLHSRFSIPGVVTVAQDNDGLAFVMIRNPLAEADIYLQGATVTHFKPQGSKDVLWLSSKSHFAKDKPIRGGIPICWPWFGPHAVDPNRPQHGFARKMEWDLLEAVSTSDRRTRVILQLKSGAETKALFPHDFVLTYTVVVGAALEAELSVHNPGPEPFAFSEALHSYLHVGDVEQARLEGLQNASFVDKVKDRQHFVQLEKDLVFRERRDRIYLNAPKQAVIQDPVLGRTIRVEKAGCQDLVVWNPQAQLAATLADVGQGEWKKFLCVEAANTGESPVTLAPLGTHTMLTRIS